MSEADPTPVDLFIIGGGINGCGIARDAAGRGYSVCLCEADDLGSGTSSASTKLVHGGLRYLEFFEFGLVRKALMEREVLWRMAPHIIWPLRFVLPHHKGLRPAWLLRLGLFIYDYIGGRRMLPPTRVVDLANDPTGAPLRPAFKRAFEYSDCWVDDARLVVLNARDAADKGADIRPHAKVTRAKRHEGRWQVEFEDAATRTTHRVLARFLVNAAGPWVDEVLKSALGRNDAQNVRLVRGSHIVVGKLFEHDRCYIFQNADDRIVFAIPYENDFTLIGTTDQDHKDPLGAIAASEDEVAYLCSVASEYFRKTLSPDDVIWSYSGVRPLFDDKASKAQEATRDYVIKQDGDAASGVLVNIFGGKITTYRKLAEAVLDIAEQTIGAKAAPWTAESTLPGGDFETVEFDDLFTRYRQCYRWAAEAHLHRLLRCYGTRTDKILGDAQSIDDLGRHFGADLFEAEVVYVMNNEWARQADDVLYRRTKLGLRVTEEAKRSLADFMAGR